MTKIICWVFVGALLAGCASPMYTGSSIKDIGKPDVVIIKDNRTRPGFQQTMESWLKTNGYQYAVVPEGSGFDVNKLNLEYVGHWRWDVALFLTSVTSLIQCRI